MAFPLYRAALGAGFFLPNVSALLLTHVSYVSWDFDRETADSLKSVVLDDGIRERLVGRGNFDYNDAKRVFDDLVASGASPAEARQRIAAAAWRVRTSSVWYIERQLQLPLASIGFQLAPACCIPGRQLTRELDGKGLFRHHWGYWRWNSGLDKGSYLEYFDRFVEMSRALKVYSKTAEDFYVASIRPYITDTLKPLRDPLHLRYLLTDPFIIVAWIGLFLCFWPAQRMTLLVIAVPFGVIYATVVYTHVFGDNRHSHPLIPVMVVGAVKAAEAFFEGRYWKKIPRLWARS
jgi:hypothetical protein